MWDEITYPFLIFDGCTVEVWEWISNLIPYFKMDVITYPCRIPIVYQGAGGLVWLHKDFSYRECDFIAHDHAMCTGDNVDVAFALVGCAMFYNHIMSIAQFGLVSAQGRRQQPARYWLFLVFQGRVLTSKKAGFQLYAPCQCWESK